MRGQFGNWEKEFGFLQFSFLGHGCNNRGRSTSLLHSKVRASDLGLWTHLSFPGVSDSFSLKLNESATPWLPAVTTPWSVSQYLDSLIAGPTRLFEYGIFERRQGFMLARMVFGVWSSKAEFSRRGGNK